MYAIVEISGKQYKIEKDVTINVDKIEGNSGEALAIDKILLFADGENVKIGQPYLSDVSVKAKVLGEVKGKKVRGIKFKKRKSYTRTLGHRALFSQVKIDDIVVK